MAYLVMMRPANPMTVEQVTQMVHASVQRNSTIAQVTAFLKSKRIGSSYLDGKKFDLRLESAAVESGLPIHQLGGMTLALIRDTSRGPLVSGDIQLAFFYDKQGRMLKYTVREVFTGL